MENLNEQNPFYRGYKIKWSDTLHKLTFTSKEIKFIKETMALNKGIDVLDTKFLKSKKSIVVVKKDSIYNDNYPYSSTKTKKYLPVYNFTKPVYNKSKNIALFDFYVSSNSRIYNGVGRCMIIMKKVSHQWKFVGFEKEVGMSH